MAPSLEFCNFHLWISPGQGAQLHEAVKRTYWSAYSKHTNLFSGKDVPKKIWRNSLQMGEETTVPTITQQSSFSWAGGRALQLGAALSPLVLGSGKLKCTFTSPHSTDKGHITHCSNEE